MIRRVKNEEATVHGPAQLQLSVCRLNLGPWYVAAPSAPPI